MRCDLATQACDVEDEAAMCFPIPSKCIGEVTCLCFGGSSGDCMDQDGGITIFTNNAK